MKIGEAVAAESVQLNTVDVGFINSDGKDDETQFDVETFDDLKELWLDFCSENNFSPDSVEYVVLWPYTGPAFCY